MSTPEHDPNLVPTDYQPVCENKQEGQGIEAIKSLKTILKNMKMPDSKQTHIPSTNNERISLLEHKAKGEKQGFSELKSLLQQGQEQSDKNLKEQQQRHRK